MASISRDSKGSCRLLMLDADGRRRCIRLGRLPTKVVKAIKPKIDALVAARATRTALDEELGKWLNDLDPKLYAKLAAADLAPARSDDGPRSLLAFLDRYINSRTDIKPSTKEHLERARKELVDFFGPTKLLSAISPGDADEFRRHLAETQADNTVRRTCGRAKQFFRAAVRKRLLRETPFGDMGDTNVRANRDREHFISKTDAQRVLNACPNTRCQLIFALSRYGGLRCPSEHVGLRWVDIDWEKDRFTVHSPKTERHEDGESREVPLFPELRPYLEAAFNEYERLHGRPPARSDYVIHVRNREGTNNFGPQIDRIVTKAGLKPWEKTFQNLRASRASELVKEFGAFLASEWLGHSALVARKHYWQVTDEDFQKAAGVASEQGGEGRAQKCTRQPTELGTQGVATTEQSRAIAEDCEGLRSSATTLAPRVGERKPLDSPMKTGGSSKKRGKKRGNLVKLDPDLQRLIDAWSTLPERLQRGVMAIVGGGG